MYQEAPLSTNSQLQVGIELEFVVPRNTAWEEQHLEDAPLSMNKTLVLDACYHRLAESLHEAGLPAAYSMRTKDGNQGPGINPLRASAPEGAMALRNVRIFGDPARYQHRNHYAGLLDYWHVKYETQLSDDTRYRDWVATELNTPIIPERRVFTCTTSTAGGSGAGSSFPELSTALAALYGAYDEPPHLSSMCGMHVHLAPETGCTTDYARRIVTLVHLVDKTLLFPLCHPARQCEHAPLASAFRDHPILVRRYGPGSRLRPRPTDITTMLSADALACLPASLIAAEPEAIELIWTADSIVRLLAVMEPEYRRVPSLLFKRQIARPSAADSITAATAGAYGPCTLEFRHAQASFCAAFVANWARLVLAIGRVGLLPASEFKAVLEALWRKSSTAAAADSNSDSDSDSDVIGPLTWPVCVKALDLLQVLSDGALGGGLPEALDVAFWRRRLEAMCAMRDLDIDDDGKARME